MIDKMNYITGCNYRRWKDNPLEQKYVEEWVKINKAGNVLGYIVSSKNENDTYTLSKRDLEVAVKVIQWLGTPVGRSFVENVLSSEE